MILKLTLNGMAILVGGLLVAQASDQETPVLKTPKDKFNYGVGVTFGRNLKQQAVDVDLELVIQGLKDAFSGGKLLLTEEELRRSRDSFQADLRRNQAYSRVVNQKEGAMFLMNNQTNQGVVALPSGLQYKILKAGQGKKPAETNTVECRYRGTLVNGTEFDSSPREGKPATFKVSEVIPGWREALKLMPVGSKWQLFIPPALAYGIRGRGPNIEPNTTLIFELELIAIK